MEIGDFEVDAVAGKQTAKRLRFYANLTLRSSAVPPKMATDVAAILVLAKFIC